MKTKSKTKTKVTKSTPKRKSSKSTSCSTSMGNTGCFTSSSCKPMSKKGKKSSKSTKKSTSKNRARELSGIAAAILQLVESWGQNNKGSRKSTHGYALTNNRSSGGNSNNYPTARLTGTRNAYRRTNRTSTTLNNNSRQSNQVGSWAK
jgi:hypothetical protein